MALSNTYSFGINTQLDDLFREAYERIGIIGNDQTPLNITSALMSANLELSSWPGRGLNLWLIQRQMISIFPNQPQYTLPLNTVRILEVSAIQPTRLNQGGTAFSSSGVAANCFDPTQTAGCIQTAPNGTIGYNYGPPLPNQTSPSIIYVGVTSLVSASYTLQVQASLDNINWQTVYVSPLQSYLPGQITWFVIEQSLNAQYWQIIETGGATLQIQQIYFDQPTLVGPGDRLLSALSRSEYIAIATKMNTGYPSGYYFDQTIIPTLSLWPVPSITDVNGLNTPGSQAILYTQYRYAQDVTQMFQNAELPQRFYDALVAGMATRLSMKFAPDKYPLMKQESMEAYQVAAATDFENVTLRFQPDFTAYSG